MTKSVFLFLYKFFRNSTLSYHLSTSFVTIKLQLIFPIFRHNLISKLSRYFFSFFLIVYVSGAYITTFHENHFLNPFRNFTLIPIVTNNFLSLLNAIFHSAILLLIYTTTVSNYCIFTIFLLLPPIDYYQLPNFPLSFLKGFHSLLFIALIFIPKRFTCY